MNITAIVIFIGLLIFAAYLFKELFKRIKLPDVLLLTLIGLVIGPIFHLVTPQDLGFVGPLLATITLIVILFEGGLHIGISALKDSLGKTFSITILNFIGTTGLVGVMGHFFLNLGWLPSLIIGALISGTSAAVVLPLAQQTKISESNKTILSMESVLNDVFVIIVSLALLKAYQLSSFSPATILKDVGLSFAASALIGILGGILWSFILDKLRHVQNSMFATAAFVFLLYGSAQLFGLSGPITALLFGITLGNIKLLYLPFITKLLNKYSHGLNSKEKAFFSEIVFLLKTFFYVYIGISIQLANYYWLITGLAIMLLLYIMRAGIIRVVISKETSQKEAAIITAIMPKGLAAAAVVSLPVFSQVSGGEKIQGIVYSVILFSTLLSALFIFILEKTRLINFCKLFFTNFKESDDNNGQDFEKGKKLK